MQEDAKSDDCPTNLPRMCSECHLDTQEGDLGHRCALPRTTHFFVLHLISQLIIFNF